MDLLVVRHGPAGTREDFAATGQPDDLRPLTEGGARKLKAVARGLHRIVQQIDVLASSPLVRARQTAEIIAPAYETSVIETDTLRPDASYSSFLKWAKSHANGNTVAIVGHEPHLSGLVAWLISDTGNAKLDLKKGGACLVRFEAQPKRGAGTLAWLLAPRFLRARG